MSGPMSDLDMANAKVLVESFIRRSKPAPDLVVFFRGERVDGGQAVTVESTHADGTRTVLGLIPVLPLEVVDPPPALRLLGSVPELDPTRPFTVDEVPARSITVADEMRGILGPASEPTVAIPVSLARRVATAVDGAPGPDLAGELRAAINAAEVVVGPCESCGAPGTVLFEGAAWCVECDMAAWVADGMGPR